MELYQVKVDAEQTQKHRVSHESWAQQRASREKVRNVLFESR